MIYDEMYIVSETINYTVISQIIPYLRRADGETDLESMGVRQTPARLSRVIPWEYRLNHQTLFGGMALIDLESENFNLEILGNLAKSGQFTRQLLIDCAFFLIHCSNINNMCVYYLWFQL